MQWAFILVICIIAISVIVIAMVRTRLKNKSKELAEKLNHISAYSEKSNYEQARERLSALNEGVFIDIPSSPQRKKKISSIIIRYISKRHIHF